WSKAIDCLNTAVGANEGECPIEAIEQCANYRVRQATQDWFKVRRMLGDDDAEAADILRAPFVRTIEDAIKELDTLCARAPNAERYVLLGSACKRLAMIVDDPRARGESIVNMANYYARAAEFERWKAYATVN